MVGSGRFGSARVFSGGKSPPPDLEQALRSGDVLEPVLAEIAERQIGGELAVDELGRAVGEERLAAVGGAHDAGGVVDVEAGVEAVGLHRLAGVEADADHDRLRLPGVLGERPLPGDRGGDGVARVWEREEEAVALHLHLDAAVCREGLAQQGPVRRQRAHVRLAAELLQHARRALDVREEEGDGAPR